MFAERRLLVLDLERVEPSVVPVWERSRFLERLTSVCPEWVVWDPTKEWGSLGVPTFDDFPAVLTYAQGREATALVLVQGDQVFLDTQLAREGIEGFHPDRTDYFTQWEHCRLPVGVGVRAVSIQALERIDCQSPNGSIEHIISNPASFKYNYDLTHQMSYEDSLLDSRDSVDLRQMIDHSDNGLLWNMSGFLSLARQNGAETLAYRPEYSAPHVDERRMPAAYGFESLECAEFPTYIMFDIINVCNARCIHCPQSLTNLNGGKPDFLAERGHLNMDTYKQVIDECADHEIHFVRITADGEPLVHKQLVEMVEYATQRGVGPVGLTTNGSLLTPARARKLIEAGLFMVDFSLDAATPKTFEIVRTGLKWDKVTGNAKEFIRIRDELGAPTKVMVSFVKQRANIHELEAFIDYWTPLVDEVLIREMISNVGLIETSESSFPGWDHRWPCVHFFRRVVINHQGVLKACPIDWQNKTAYRSMSETSVFDAWHSHHYWMNRMEHLNDEIPDNRICKKCRDWAGTPWEMGYEKVIARMGE